MHHRPFVAVLVAACCVASSRAQNGAHPTPAQIDRAARAKPTTTIVRRAHAAAQSGLPPAPTVGVTGGDDCDSPDVIVGTGQFAFDITTATTGDDNQTEPLCDQAGAGMAILNDVWFLWNAPSTGLARITTCGTTSVDTKLAAYEHYFCPLQGLALACNDDACAGLQSTIEFACTSGTDYMIQIGMYPGTFPPAAPGAGMFDVSILSTPSNDDCSTPQTIVGTTLVTFDNSQATTGSEGQAEAQCFYLGGTGIQRDIWYSWTAPFTGTGEVRTCGSALDTKIAVYGAAGCPTSSSIACNDDGCGLQSRALFPCSSGQTYTFQVGLWQGTHAGGPGTLEVLGVAAPANDGCSTPASIAGAGPFAFDDTNATTGSEGQGELACNQIGGTAVRGDLWYAWTAPSTGSFSVQTLGLTEVDTKIAVYDGAACPLAAALACNDDANSPANVYLQSQAVFFAVAGNAYAIQLGTSASAFVGGTGEFSIRPVGVPSNDDCQNPSILSGNAAHFFDNTQATTGAQGQAESACSLLGSSSVSEDVWYAWTADSNGTATLSFCGSTSVDTKVAVYAGFGCPVAAAVACNDDACGAIGYQSEATFPVACGQTYAIQVGVYPLYGAPAGGEGRFTFAIAGSGSCTTGSVTCAGDGAAPHTACPCGNVSVMADQVGCLNSLGTGGRLRSIGTASVSGDTLVLSGTQMTNGASLYFQGTTQSNGGNGAVFGDGLRCAAGTIVRLGTETSNGGSSQYPGSGEAPVSVRGQLPPAGGMRVYQVWYRNAAAFCTPNTFNLTNGLQVVWQP